MQQYGFAPDTLVDTTDSDGDGPDNWQEWIAGTVPTDTSSALRMLTPTGSIAGVAVRWQSVAKRNYFLERSATLSAQPFSTIQTNVPGQTGETSFTDTNAIGAGPYFYRVRVQ